MASDLSSVRRGLPPRGAAHPACRGERGVHKDRPYCVPHGRPGRPPTRVCVGQAPTGAREGGGGGGGSDPGTRI